MPIDLDKVIENKALLSLNMYCKLYLDSEESRQWVDEIRSAMKELKLGEFRCRDASFVRSENGLVVSRDFYK